jgi:hypothetical protein
MGRNFPDLACETLREQAATIALLWAKVARLESRADATGCHCDEADLGVGFEYEDHRWLFRRRHRQPMHWMPLPEIPNGVKP